jgi:preprotein translocase subunit SecG
LPTLRRRASLPRFFSFKSKEPTTMMILLTILHVVVAVFLILVVLLQTGKRADLAGAFGGGGSQTAFGARGAATLLSRLTSWSAGIFMATSLLLSLMSSTSGGGHGSVLDALPAKTPAASPAPAQPPAPASSPAPSPAPSK